MNEVGFLDWMMTLGQDLVSNDQVTFLEHPKTEIYIPHLIANFGMTVQEEEEENSN